MTYPKLTRYVEWDEEYPITQLDFTIASDPSLKALSEYTRGVKTKTIYHNPTDPTDVIVSKEFTEDYDNRELIIKFTWLDNLNNVFTSKTKVVTLSETEWESRFRDQRERVFDDLKGRAKRFNAEQYIDAIYTQFAAEKLDYVNTGSSLFADSIKGFLLIDTDLLPDGVEKRGIVQLQTLLNSSLDGEVKVYETLVFLTS